MKEMSRTMRELAHLLTQRKIQLEGMGGKKGLVRIRTKRKRRSVSRKELNNKISNRKMTLKITRMRNLKKIKLPMWKLSKYHNLTIRLF
jgi:hypothetical protein